MRRFKGEDYKVCIINTYGQWAHRGDVRNTVYIRKYRADLNHLSGYLDGDFWTQLFWHEVTQIVPTVGSWDFVLRKCESLRDSI